MTRWQDKTDAELNSALGKIEHHVLQRCTKKEISSNSDGAVRFESSAFLHGVKYVNYCNDWSDIGPIIQREHIMLQPHMAGGQWKATGFVKQEDIFKTYAVAYDDSPLRAAVICRLMMEEASCSTQA